MPPSCPDRLLEKLSELLAARTGLNFPEERWGDLERGIAAVAPTFGLADVETCARWLVSTPLTRSQIELLASHLTVGETYFFREERSFEVLEQHIFPLLLRERANSGRRLRIWSAGCCTGEEAYSIAMLVDWLIPRSEKWNVTILATDINPAFLRKAAEGEYGEWSFRATPTWVRDRYFKHGRKSRYELQPRMRKRVAFSCLNLADDAYPSLTNNTNAMDVIFCRNVLMYFTPEQAKKVVDKLYRSLVDGGWLIVSPAETSSSLFSMFTAVWFPDVVIYRKLPDTQSTAAGIAFPDTLTSRVAETFSMERVVANAEFLVPSREAAFSTGHSSAQSAGVSVSEADAAEALISARACANQGKLAEAEQWCEKAIAVDKLNPANQYLLATIRQELGRNDAAMQSLVSALYLEPDFVLAHFALGNLCLSQSRSRDAVRHFDTALTLLRAHPFDEPLPESDGLTAGRLTEIISSIRSSLPSAAVRP